MIQRTLSSPLSCLFILISLVAHSHAYSLTSSGAPECSGTVTLTDPIGVFSDGDQRYQNGMLCGWTISPVFPSGDSAIHLDLLFLDTEISFDKLKVYAGVDNTGTLLATWEGRSLQNLTLSGPSLYVEFSSDSTYAYYGFVAVYYTDSLAALAMTLCPEDCTSRGVCTNSSNPNAHAYCDCQAGYTYANCLNDDLLRITTMYNDFNTSALATLPGFNWESSPAAAINNSNIDYCSWTYLTCYNDRINTVLMPNLPTGLNRLPSILPFGIEYVDFHNNSVSGTIPDTWNYNLFGMLLSVDLSNNKLSGTMPPNSFSSQLKLQTLDLSHNRLEGDIYTWIWRNAALTSLKLDDNSLAGFLPSAFEFLPDGSVSLTNNSFWCPLPSYSSLQPSNCVNMTLSTVTPLVGSAGGFTVTLSGENFLRASSASSLVTDLHCVLESESGVTSAVARWVSLSQLVCTFPPSPPGAAHIYIGYKGSTQASANALSFFVHPECSPGTFLPSLLDTECVVCPDGGACRGNAEPAQAAAGYYPSQVQNYRFYRCKSSGCEGGGKPEASLCLSDRLCVLKGDVAGCLLCGTCVYSPGGGYSARKRLGDASVQPAIAAFTEPKPCADGYEGFMCSKCSYGYYSSRNSCVACSGRISVLLQIALFVVPALLALLILYKSTSVLHFSSTALFLEFVQTTSLFLTFSLVWSADLTDALHGFQLFTFDLSYLSPECAYSSTSNFYFQFGIFMSLPMGALFLFVLFFLCWKIGSDLLPSPAKRAAQSATVYAAEQTEQPEPLTGSFIAKRRRSSIVDPAGVHRQISVPLGQTFGAELDQFKGDGEVKDKWRQAPDLKLSVRRTPTVDIFPSPPRGLCCFWTNGIYVPDFDWDRRLDHFIDGFYLVLVVAHIPLSHSVLEYFTCASNADVTYMVSHPYIECWTGDHIKYMPLAVAGLIVYSIGIPLLFFLTLYYSRSSLQTGKLRARFGSIYRLYKSETYYWEIVLRFRALLLTALPTLVPGNGVGAACLALVLFLAMMWVHWDLHPFVYLRNNYVAQLVDVAFVAMLFGGLAFTSLADQSSSLPEESLKSSVTARVVSAILLVVLGGTLLALLHAVLFEVFYFSHELLIAQMNCFSPLFKSRFMVWLFSTDRSYLKDFRAGLQTRAYYLPAPVPKQFHRQLLAAECLRAPLHRGDSFYHEQLNSAKMIVQHERALEQAHPAGHMLRRASASSAASHGSGTLHGPALSPHGSRNQLSHRPTSGHQLPEASAVHPAGLPEMREIDEDLEREAAEALHIETAAAAALQTPANIDADDDYDPNELQRPNLNQPGSSQNQAQENSQMAHQPRTAFQSDVPIAEGTQSLGVEANTRAALRASWQRGRQLYPTQYNPGNELLAHPLNRQLSEPAQSHIIEMQPATSINELNRAVVAPMVSPPENASLAAVTSDVSRRSTRNLPAAFKSMEWHQPVTGVSE